MGRRHRLSQRAGVQGPNIIKFKLYSALSRLAAVVMISSQQPRASCAKHWVRRICSMLWSVDMWPRLFSSSDSLSLSDDNAHKHSIKPSTSSRNPVQLLSRQLASHLWLPVGETSKGFHLTIHAKMSNALTVIFAFHARDHIHFPGSEHKG